jgi:hypothetical protein
MPLKVAGGTMRIALVLVMTATLGMSALGQAPEVKQPFSIVISTEKLVVNVGDPVIIMLRLTNNSDHAVGPGWWGQDNLGVMDQADQFDVRDSRGNVFRKKKRDPGFPIMGNGAMTLMTPGQTRSYAQDFARWYDLSQPGKYTIQALRPTSENGKKIMVKSNKITITVKK